MAPLASRDDRRLEHVHEPYSSLPVPERWHHCRPSAYLREQGGDLANPPRAEPEQDVRPELHGHRALRILAQSEARDPEIRSLLLDAA